MRLTTFILLTTIMHVSASTFGQKITLNAKAASLNSIIKEISNQSGYEFFFDAGLILKSKPITINIRNLSIEETLKKSFQDQPFTYHIKNKIVILKEQQLPNQWPNIIKITVRGTVFDENNKPFSNVSVRVKGSPITVTTNVDGKFEIANVDEKAIIIISYIGYTPQELNVSENLGIIRLKLNEAKLDEVSIVSTGYQTLPKERATGSFEQIDNKLFNRSTGTDVISRLSGVSFATNLGGYQAPLGELNHRTSPLAKFSIRGLSTLLPDKKPLLVVDNFPYEGDINNLNPNDVENVTILKDAAAASIWGTRAGNGVIVITTKKGTFNTPLVVTANSNLTVGQKPNLFYLPKINSSDLVDYQTSLYQNGRFDGSIDDKYAFIPQLIDLLDQKNQSPNDPFIQQKITALRNNDIRNDQLKYFYRNPISQQYALNINGGSKQMTYYISSGYDKNLEKLVTDGFDRINLRMSSTIRLIKNLDIETGLLYTLSTYRETAGSGNYLDTYSVLPYDRLSNDNGMAIAVYPAGIRKAYLDTTGNGRLLDWSFKPIDERFKTPRILKNQDVLLNLGLNYKINPIFSASVKYQFEKNHGKDATNYQLGSFYTRNFINSYSQYSYSDLNKPVIRPIAIGDILNNNYLDLLTHTVRGQINANKTWNDIHQLSLIAGTEIRQVHNESFNTGPIYGYNNNPISVQNIDNSHQYESTDGSYQYPLYNDPDYWGNAAIPSGVSFTNMTNRFTSLYANGSYTFKTRYSISGSIRKDASNLFGVKPNRRGQPLWSAGLNWILSEEPFFKSGFLSFLKLRATYGYQGNVANNYSAYPIIAYQNFPSPINQLPFATTTNPPNPSLGWETVGTLNFGIDFSTRNSRISGSLDYYNKRSSNLIAPVPVPLNTGYNKLPVNSSNLQGNGFELNLNTKNLILGNFTWNTTTLFSYSRTKVKNYLVSNTLASNYVMIPGGTLQSGAFKEDDDAYSLYAYKWAGLNPETGAPRGFLNGQVSEDYLAIMNSDVKDLENMGSISPKYFGSFRNTFTYKNFSISGNIIFKFGYVIGREGLNYAALFEGGSSTSDYAKRWQKTGDEKFTQIPASNYPVDYNANAFYLSSAALVLKGDHIRLQDINFEYTVPNKVYVLKNLRVYANVTNIGILWRANKLGIDPESGNFLPNPRTISLGFNASF